MGTKSREVLTDTELQDAFYSGLYRGNSHHLALRAVEQAVLAKLHDDESPVNGHWECAVAARELERKAWDAAAAFCWGPNSGDPENAQNSERDRRYPSLTPPKPEGVTLSDGTRWVKISGHEGWNGISPGRVRFAHVPDCRTPEDFEKVARYLREMAP